MVGKRHHRHVVQYQDVGVGLHDGQFREATTSVDDGHLLAELRHAHVGDEVGLPASLVGHGGSQALPTLLANQAVLSPGDPRPGRVDFETLTTWCANASPECAHPIGRAFAGPCVRAALSR